MNKVVNRLMSVLMLVGSIIAVTSYAEDRLTSLNHAQLTLPQASDSQLLYQSSSIDSHNVVNHGHINEMSAKTSDPVSYLEKKAMVINSYQLRDPRAQPSLM